MKKFKLSDLENCELKKNEQNDVKGGIWSCFDTFDGSRRNMGGLTGLVDPGPNPNPWDDDIIIRFPYPYY